MTLRIAQTTFTGSNGKIGILSRVLGSVTNNNGFRIGFIVPGTHWLGGWVGPRAGLDDVEKRK
jgi:hypothetical protein